jgi:hypothetical protein
MKGQGQFIPDFPIFMEMIVCKANQQQREETKQKSNLDLLF